MSDRVSVTITIGGRLARRHRDRFVACVEDAGLSTDRDGPPFEVSQLVSGGPLRLHANDVAWGRVEPLETLCIALALPFVRWSGGCPGQFGPELGVFAGAGPVQGFAADEEQNAVICCATAERLGSYAAIMAQFAAAGFVVPPLVLTGRPDRPPSG